MSYRFLWKQIASKALSSALARSLLAIDTDALWEKAVRTQAIPPEQMAKLKEEIGQVLRDVEARGKQERELVTQVLKELAAQIMKGGFIR
jgi:hypothetical protein